MTDGYSISYSFQQQAPRPAATSAELFAVDELTACPLAQGMLVVGRTTGNRLAVQASIAAALELGQRHLSAGLERGLTLTDPGAAGQYFVLRLRGRPYEVFAALFLDTRHRAIAFEEIFHGTLDASEVHPREVVRRALAHNAACVIVGHNHPSGHAEPSAADRAVTVRLKQALALVDLRLLDHLVIGDGLPVSMAARGWV